MAATVVLIMTVLHLIAFHRTSSTGDSSESTSISTTVSTTSTTKNSAGIASSTNTSTITSTSSSLASTLSNTTVNITSTTTNSTWIASSTNTSTITSPSKSSENMGGKTMSTTTYATVIATSTVTATTPIIAGSSLTESKNTASTVVSTTTFVPGMSHSETNSFIFLKDPLYNGLIWASIGFAAALVLMLVVKILICLRKCCRKKSPSGTEDDRNKNTDQAEFKNDVTLTPHIYSSEPLVNASHHPPTYELVSESASPYAEVNGPDETTSPCSLYSEVALVRAPTCRPKSQAVKNGTTNAEESVSAGSTTVKIETTENLYDDAATIGAALERLPTQTGNTSDNCEPATGVEDTVAPVYCDVNRIKETPTPDIKDQKPTSPFAMNYANTIKSLAQKFKPPSNDLKADNGNAIYDDAAIVKMNDTKTNADTQYDDADNVYQEASAVKLERLADSKKTNDTQLCQAKHSNNPSKGNHVEHGTEMHSSEEDMTLVENTLYGEMKGK